jgi:hypothetical protein
MAMGESLQLQTSKLIAERGGNKKLGEEPILDLVQEICEPNTERGEWINSYDIVGTTGVLNFERKSSPGKCGTECKAIAQNCEDIRTEVGESEIAEKLFRGGYSSPGHEFAGILCKTLTRVCKSASKPLKKQRLDEAFEEFDPKAIFLSLSFPLNT